MGSQINNHITAKAASLASEVPIGAELAASVGSDSPAVADPIFSDAELASLKILHFQGFQKQGDSWLNINPLTVEFHLNQMLPSHEHHGLLTKLHHTLLDLNDQRSIQSPQDLAKIIFQEQWQSGNFIPLDEAISRVSSFAANAETQRLVSFAFGILGHLLHTPSQILPKAPMSLREPSDLAHALWGDPEALRPLDQTDLEIKLHHLSGFEQQLMASHPPGEGDVYRLIRKSIHTLVTQVAYLDPKLLEGVEKQRTVLLSLLDGSAAELSKVDKLARIGAITPNCSPSIQASLEILASAIHSSMDVTREQGQLDQSSVTIGYLAWREIQRITQNPLLDRAFRNALKNDPLLKEIHDRLEVGGLLFGTRNRDGSLHVSKVVPYKEMEPGFFGPFPTLRISSDGLDKVFKKMSNMGLELLGDWHLHPGDTLPFPSLRGDPRVYREIVGSNFREGQTALQIITKRSETGPQLFVYGLYPFAEEREIKLPVGIQSLWFPDQDVGKVNAIYRGYSTSMPEPSKLERFQDWVKEKIELALMWLQMPKK